MTRLPSHSSPDIHGSSLSHPKRPSPKSQLANGYYSFPSHRERSEIITLSAAQSKRNSRLETGELSHRNVSSLWFLILLVACANGQTIQPTPTKTTVPIIITKTLTPIPIATSTPQPRLSPITYGPDAGDFPPNVNPLTGRPVQNPSLLKLPAVLVSISNMPVTARPQAGPSFAPWVFELFIGEGTTRFMGVFYGDYPRAVPNVHGGCEVREEILHPKGDWIGNRVWLDENENGLQDAWEVGVGGVCVRLLNGISHEVLSEATTDSNGYYAFERPDVESIIQFMKPEFYQFTKP